MSVTEPVQQASLIRPALLPMRVMEVDFAWLTARRDEIARLGNMQSDPTPFQTVEWLQAWWNAFGQDYEPHILAVVAGDQLLGIAPLMMSRRRGWRVLEWLAAGRSDHAPLLLFPGQERAILTALERYLTEVPWRWDLLSLRTLQAEHHARVREGFHGSLLHEVDDVSPRALVTMSWDDFLASKTKKHRGNIRRLLREQEKGAISVQCETECTAALLDELADVEAHSWKARSGSLRMRGAGESFFRNALSAFSARSWLEIWTCRAHGRLLAHLITFRYCDRIYYYNGAYREDYTQYTGLSPGALLIAHALRSAHDRHMRSFDFLRGDEAYKALWINEPRSLYHVVLRADTWRGRFACLTQIRLRWWLRRSALARRVHVWIESRKTR